MDGYGGPRHFHLRGDYVYVIVGKLMRVYLVRADGSLDEITTDPVAITPSRCTHCGEYQGAAGHDWCHVGWRRRQDYWEQLDG